MSLSVTGKLRGNARMPGFHFNVLRRYMSSLGSAERKVPASRTCSLENVSPKSEVIVMVVLMESF